MCIYPDRCFNPPSTKLNKGWSSGYAVYFTTLCVLKPLFSLPRDLRVTYWSAMAPFCTTSLLQPTASAKLIFIVSGFFPNLSTYRKPIKIQLRISILLQGEERGERRGGRGRGRLVVESLPRTQGLPFAHILSVSAKIMDPENKSSVPYSCSVLSVVGQCRKYNCAGIPLHEQAAEG